MLVCLSITLELNPADNTADVISKVNKITTENSFVLTGLDFAVVKLRHTFTFNIQFRIIIYYTLINFVN